ncbi:hypothetical protein BH20CHL3_BH20CHL3_00490 [soil metagenome]
MTSETTRIETVKPNRKSRRRGANAGDNDLWTLPALVWAIHWLLTQIPAALAYHYGTIRTMREHPPRSGPFVDDFGPLSGARNRILEPLDGLTHWIVEPFRSWDGTWYHLLATRGYDPDFAATAAFWPLYPWLMDLGGQVTGWSPESVGYLTSNIAFFFALHYLYRLVMLDFDTSIARRTLWAISLFPTAFFFTAVYTESFFLMLVVAALLYARRGDWLVAGIIGLLAALTRSAGVMLLAPFGIIFLQQFGWSLRRWFPQAFAAALPALGPAIFGWFLTTRGLGFFDWANQQWQWNRFSASPWRTFDCALNGCDAEVRFITGTTGTSTVHPIDWGWIGQLLDNLNWTFLTSSEFRFRFGESHVLELIVTVLAIVLVLVGLRIVPLYYTALAMPALIVPLLTPSSVNPLMSMPRFVLPLFPLFVVAAVLLRNRKIGWVLAVSSSLLLILLTMQFALWYWVS